MVFGVDARDVELIDGASYGFQDVYDEEGNDSFKSKIMTDEDFREAKEWSNKIFDKIHKAKTLQQLKDSIPTNLPYFIEIIDNEIIFNWSCPNRCNVEYTFGFRINYANIS